jgi:predicted GNAT superfamily acetyltransferase
MPSRAVPTLAPPAGVTIRPFADRAEREAAVALQKEIWGADFREVVPAALLWATQRVGGIAAGAFDENGRLLGLVFGVTGWSGGRPTHWSDLLAVHPSARGHGISIALKAYQRDALNDMGVDSVGWSFDPLESRNAHINFGRLGIYASEYVRDLYGTTASPLHDALGTDRLIAWWPIASDRVVRRLAGRERPPSAAEIAALPAANRVERGRAFPEPREPVLDREAKRLRVTIPATIQTLGHHAMSRSVPSASCSGDAVVP